MFRLWGKEFKDNHMLRDTVICDETDETRTHKIFNALDSICYEFDLSKPIWLDHNIDEFKRHDKTRFYQDNFVLMSMVFAVLVGVLAGYFPAKRAMKLSPLAAIRNE